ncbi:hypothetical protein NIES2101_13260 [Calothrix sp. HK-06]|nr:hypothetical protein NIES2101_13260 [Calothrix sp. HK-06]
MLLLLPLSSEAKIQQGKVKKEGTLAIEVVFFSLAVADYHSALTWYERLMGRQPDMITSENEVAWQLSVNKYV